MQPIEVVEGILRQNLNLISGAPHKSLQISDISDCLGCTRGIYFEMA
jgi:hypothetical protein